MAAGSGFGAANASAIVTLSSSGWVNCPAAFCRDATGQLLRTFA